MNLELPMSSLENWLVDGQESEFSISSKAGFEPITIETYRM